MVALAWQSAHSFKFWSLMANANLVTRQMLYKQVGSFKWKWTNELDNSNQNFIEYCERTAFDLVFLSSKKYNRNKIWISSLLFIKLTQKSTQWKVILLSFIWSYSDLNSLIKLFSGLDFFSSDLLVVQQ